MLKKLYENKCNKCQKPQPVNQQLTEKYKTDVFDCGMKCECGGMFVLWVDGKAMEVRENDN